MKFTFEKPFNFSRFPSILKCHEHYNQLVEESYYTEARYEDGKCSKDEWAKALDICDEYYVGEDDLVGLVDGDFIYELPLSYYNY